MQPRQTTNAEQLGDLWPYPIVRAPGSRVARKSRVAGWEDG